MSVWRSKGLKYERCTCQDKMTTRQDKTRQEKTRQDKTRQDKTRQDKTRQDTRSPGERPLPSLTKDKSKVRGKSKGADEEGMIEKRMIEKKMAANPSRVVTLRRKENEFFQEKWHILLLYPPYKRHK